MKCNSDLIIIVYFGPHRCFVYMFVFEYLCLYVCIEVIRCVDLCKCTFPVLFEMSPAHLTHIFFFVFSDTDHIREQTPEQAQPRGV